MGSWEAGDGTHGRQGMGDGGGGGGEVEGGR